MARGNLPDQTPPVPADMFFVINDLYLYLKSLNRDLQIVENGATGFFTTVDGKTVTVVKGRITTIV